MAFFIGIVFCGHFLLLVFLRMPFKCSVDSAQFSVKFCSEKERHLQKTMQTLAECDGVEARARVSFFYLLIDNF